MPRALAARQVGRSTHRLLRDAVRVRPGGASWPVALRNALGVVLPLVVGAAAGAPALGVPAALGALQVSLADRPGPYRLQVVRMLGTAVAASLTAGLAMLLGHSVLGSALLICVLGFCAGQLLALGPAASTIGVAATVIALVLGHTAQSGSQAVGTALLVLAGGLLQTVFGIVAWPFARHGPEREAIARLYDRLASVASVPDPSSAPPLGTALIDVRTTLSGPGHAHGGEIASYRMLYDHAARARRTVLVLTDYANRLDDAGQTAAAARIRRRLRAASRTLSGIAESIRTGRPPRLPAALDPARSRRIAGAEGPDATVIERAAADRLQNLAGQLRAMAQTARRGAGADIVAPAEPGSVLALARYSLGTVRANLAPGSPSFRHALRLAVILPVLDVLGRVIGDAHSYWIPLTVLIVLRPDYATTFERSVLRVMGTIVGIVVGSVLAHVVLGNSVVGLILVAAVSFAGMRRAGPNNFGLTALCVSGLVVVLLSLSGVPAMTTVLDRTLDTLLGGVIAIIAVLIWPSWVRRRIPEQLGALIERYREWLLLMADPDSLESRRTAARRAVRLARSAAEASLGRAREEPLGSHRDDDRDAALLGHTHRLAFALLAFDAAGDAARTTSRVPELRHLVDAAADDLALAEAVLNGRAHPGHPVPLRRLFGASADALTAAGIVQAPALVDATDRLVDAIDAIVAASGAPDPASAE